MSIFKIEKRDGFVVDFDPIKIKSAILKALKATSSGEDETAETLCSFVLEELIKKYSFQVPTVENVQDIVEEVLMGKCFYKAAKSYIVYRDTRKKIRDTGGILIDAKAIITGYINKKDWRVNENSNAGYSYASLMNHISSSVVAHYVVNDVYPTEISNLHVGGDFHIHDMGCGIVGYCAGWSLLNLLLEGFEGQAGRASASPAKHLDTILGQIVNYMGTLQTEWAGAQAFSSFDTYLAPFVRYDNLSYKDVEQAIQRFIFGMNIASRWGQTPFTNITLDWTVPPDMKDRPVIIGGKEMKETYKEFQTEMDMINKAFIKIMINGDKNGRIFTFPIPTYNLMKDFDWDTENANLLFELTGKYGTPYFQNFIGSNLSPYMVRSLCCRLSLSLKDLEEKTGGLFGAGESTGSIGVVTINMPRIGYLSQTKEAFYERLVYLMDKAKESLEIKRKIISENYERGLMPYTKKYLPKRFSRHFSTIGLIGMHECCLNFLNKSIYDEEGRDFVIEILGFMREKLKKFQEETKNLYNLEATPAEGTTYRLAKIDVEKYGDDIITSGEDNPYYTNSSQLPVGQTEDLFLALQHQSDIQSMYNGGTVFHTFLGSRISDPTTVKNLVKKIAFNFKLPYFTITPTFTICPIHGYIAGEHEVCPYEI